MRRTVLAAASAVLLACLGACADDSDAASDEAVAVQPAESETPTPTDPFAWTDVSYEDYLDAAEQIGLRPDVLVPQAGFSSGLGALCRTSAEEMVVMRSAHVEDVADSGTYSTAKYLGDEVGLRLGMACPQRMTDWTAAGLAQDDSEQNGTEQDGTEQDGAEESSVTDDDLDRATAEESAEGEGGPDHGYIHDGDHHDRYHPGDPGSRSSGAGSSDSGAGSTAGNGSRQY